MAELSIPYVRRQLARRQTSGAGGVPQQPRIPDVSGVYGQVAGLGEDLQQISGQMAQLAAQKQRARDVVTLTALEASIDEQVAARAEEIRRDASIHPFDYRPQLAAYRDQLLESADIPGRLRAVATAKVQASTSRFLIAIDQEGTKRGIDQALGTLDLRTDQLIRRQVAEPDPQQRDALETELRDLYRSYVDSGILSATDAITRLRKTRDQSAVYQVQQAIRLNPDAAVDQLEKGLEANAGIPPEAYGKLVDEARRVQRERFHFAQAQEDQIRKDTERLQHEQEAIAFGQVQAGRLSKVGLDRLRDGRQVSPQGYETLVRYLDTKAREDRAEGRARESLAIQREERRNRETESQLSILASTGQLDERQILDYATAKQLPATAIDGAIQKAQARRNATESQWAKEHAQAEEILSKSFTKGPFEVLEPVTAEAYAAALDELTRRSKAFGGDESPLEAVQRLVPKYQASLDADRDRQLQGLQQRLMFRTPDDLDASGLKFRLPTVYEEQRKLFRKLDQLLPKTPAPTGKPSESGPSFWQRWFGGGSEEGTIQRRGRRDH